MKYAKTQNLIRLVATLALAVSVTQTSLSAHGKTSRTKAPTTAHGVQVLEPEAVAGGQASYVDIYVCATMVLAAPFFPIVIIPAIPICYSAYTSTLG